MPSRVVSKAARKARDTRLRKTYGISSRQWSAMFKRQGGQCPICLKNLFKPWNAEGKVAANVDHDHKTGRIRGLLCWLCNRKRVGNMTAQLSRRVTEYLESSFDGREI